MTYQRFEDLPVWQKAADLYEAAEELLETEAFLASRGFRDQLNRAALSVSNNIAEGFERATTNELLAFIYIARGSAGEVRSMLCFKGATFPEGRLVRRSEVPNFKSQIHRRVLLPPASGLGRGAAELRDQRSATLK